MIFKTIRARNPTIIPAQLPDPSSWLSFCSKSFYACRESDCTMLWGGGHWV